MPNTGPSGGGSITTWSGGLSLQYSIPYLQSQIKDYGLPSVLANLTPVVELGFSSAAGSSAIQPVSNPTTFLLGTGAVWTGRSSLDLGRVALAAERGFRTQYRRDRAIPSLFR